MTIDAWLQAAIADAGRRGLSDLKPILETLARAWSALPPSDVWWRERLADAAAAIMARLKLTRRHAAVKRVPPATASASSSSRMCVSRYSTL